MFSHMQRREAHVSLWVLQVSKQRLLSYYFHSKMAKDI